MRTRRFANNERIRSKERRLLEVLRRREAARTLTMFPKGIIGVLSHTTTVGGTTSTINTPLIALVETATENWQVDYASVPDSTGGFGDVVIAAGKQIAELATSGLVSFTGQSVGTYIVYAQHSGEDENPETRDPPTMYSGGTGVFAQHRTFYGHAQPDGEPIPRNDYDSTLTPAVVSEYVDRLTIAFAPSGSVPANATELLQVVWDGSQITAVTSIARAIDLTSIYDHIGAGGDAHALVTTVAHGFMSSEDKVKLNAYPTTVASAAIANATMARDANGRAKVAAPSASDDIARKLEVDAVAATLGNYVRHDTAAQGLTGTQKANARTNIDASESGHSHDSLYVKHNTTQALTALQRSTALGNLGVYAGMIRGDGAAGSTLPVGWSVVRNAQGHYILTHNLGTSNYIVTATASFGSFATISTSSPGSTSINIYTRTSAGAAVDSWIHFVLVLLN